MMWDEWKCECLYVCAHKFMLWHMSSSLSLPLYTAIISILWLAVAWRRFKIHPLCDFLVTVHKISSYQIEMPKKSHVVMQRLQVNVQFFSSALKTIKKDNFMLSSAEHNRNAFLRLLDFSSLTHLRFQIFLFYAIIINLFIRQFRSINTPQKKTDDELAKNKIKKIFIDNFTI